MIRVQEVNLRLRRVAKVREGSGRGEEVVVTALQHQHGAMHLS